MKILRLSLGYTFLGRSKKKKRERRELLHINKITKSRTLQNALEDHQNAEAKAESLIWLQLLGVLQDKM